MIELLCIISALHGIVLKIWFYLNLQTRLTRMIFIFSQPTRPEPNFLKIFLLHQTRPVGSRRVRVGLLIYISKWVNLCFQCFLVVQCFLIFKGLVYFHQDLVTQYVVIVFHDIGVRHPESNEINKKSFTFKYSIVWFD